MAEEEKTMTPEEVKTEAKELADKEVAAIKAEMEDRFAEMQKEYEAKKAELEKDFEARKAALAKEFDARRMEADHYIHEAEITAEEHKKEIICGVCIAAAGSILAAVLMGLWHKDHR